jgi:hypothetical protein
MKTYPNDGKTCATSKNDLFFLAKWEEGETNYVAWADYTGDMFKQGDWVNDKPQKITSSEACRLTGDEWQIMIYRWKDFYSEVK